ncbi:hypothetical protein AB990_01865 [Alkalihalobacillus pseudalcaliphilus]|nr:hypothetical protein AB990_01865 [Alkalihalobacillus pseudalcaliphilus]
MTSAIYLMGVWLFVHWVFEREVQKPKSMNEKSNNMSVTQGKKMSKVTKRAERDSYSREVRE